MSGDDYWDTPEGQNDNSALPGGPQEGDHS
jgi:hypothetical protein